MLGIKARLKASKYLTGCTITLAPREQLFLRFGPDLEFLCDSSNDHSFSDDEHTFILSIQLLSLSEFIILVIILLFIILLPLKSCANQLFATKKINDN